MDGAKPNLAAAMRGKIFCHAAESHGSSHEGGDHLIGLAWTLQRSVNLYQNQNFFSVSYNFNYFFYQKMENLSFSKQYYSASLR